MAPNRVLFIDGDQWEPFGQFAAALGRHGILSDHLTVAPRHWQSRYSQHLEEALFDRTGYLVERIGQDGSGARVAPEHVARWSGPDTLDVQARDDLAHQILDGSGDPPAGLRHARALDPPSAIYDKRAMGELARAVGVPTPTTWEADLGPKQLPAVLKTPVGFGGQGVITVTQPHLWDSAANRLRRHMAGEPFAQEFVGAQMVDVGGVAADGELLVAASYRPIPHPGNPLGPPMALELIDHAQARHCAAELVAATGFHGIFTIDFTLDSSGRALFVDFNPRVFGSWAALQHLGLDIIGGYLYAHGLGGEPARTSLVDGARAHTLGPPPESASLHGWFRRSWQTISAWQPWLGITWSRQARARLLAYAGRQALRLPGQSAKR